MRDLTRDSVLRHIVQMALPIAGGLLVQSLFLLIDLYFVAQLSGAAVAGVTAAGSVVLAVTACTQILSVGTLVRISHAVGGRDRRAATGVFNQSVSLSCVAALLVLLLIYGGAPAYMELAVADRGSARAGVIYLAWLGPGLALQLALVSIGAALRAIGSVGPALAAQLVSLLINTALAPVLIVGWGTDRPLGVAGAGLGSTLSIAAGVGMLWLYFRKADRYVTFEVRALLPRLEQWRSILGIGAPAASDLAVMAIATYVMYVVSAPFGTPAQVGLSIGLRIVQAALAPAFAVALGTSVIVGQNVGARQSRRIRDSFRQCMTLNGLLMASATVLVLASPETWVRAFTQDPAAIAVGCTYLRLMSVHFLAQGVVFACSSTFQGLAQARPIWLSSAIRLGAFAVPALVLASRPGFVLEHTWHLFNVVVILQAGVCLWLVRGSFRRHLPELRPAAI